MKFARILLFLSCLALSHIALAITYEPPGVYRWHTQPNGTTTFLASSWGRYTLTEYETDDGYTIIQSPSDGYWYYAVLDSEGEYEPSNAKVGIDNPPVAPHLRRSPQRIAILRDDLGAVRLRQLSFAEKWRYMITEDIHTTLKIAVLLMDFPDRQGRKFDIGNQNIPIITREYLSNMLVSQEDYNWDSDIIATPDGYESCGSVRDFYKSLSNNQLDIEPAGPNELPAHAAEGENPAVPARTLLINPDDWRGNPIWLEMDTNFSNAEGDGYGVNNPLMYQEALELCEEKNWLPDTDPENPVYPGFDIILFVYAGYFAGWMCGEELDYPGLVGFVIGEDIGAGIMAAAVCEFWHGTKDYGQNFLQVGPIADEVLDQIAEDLYPFHSDSYGWYPRSANIDNPDEWGGGIVGEFDNGGRAGGDFSWFYNPNNQITSKHNKRRVGNNPGYWNPRDRIKMEWFGTHEELDEDIGPVTKTLTYSASQPTFISYKYIDSYDGETPIYGQFFLECRKVLTIADSIAGSPYVDFNSKGVGWYGYDYDPSQYNVWGYRITPNKNNLLIWHAEDELPQIHVQFGDGHAICTNETYSYGPDIPNDRDLRDGDESLNGNDYFPSRDWSTITEEYEGDPVIEFGPGTYQNRANPAIDYSSVDLIAAAENDEYRIKQTGFCVKDIEVSEDAPYPISFDVHTNYWGGDVTENLDLSGDHVHLGQNCTIKDGFTIEFTPPNVHADAEIFIDSDIYIEDGGALTLVAPLSDQNSNELAITSTPNNFFTIYIHEGGMLNLVCSEGELETYHFRWNAARVHVMDGGEVDWGENQHISFIGNGDDGPGLCAESADLDIQNCSFSGYDIAIELDECTGSITDVDVDDCSIGIKGSDLGSSFTMDNVCVTDFVGYGFELIGSSPTLTNCTASDCPTQGTDLPVGLYCYDSYPILEDCEFDGNYRGLEAYGLTTVVKAGGTSFSYNEYAGFYTYDALAYLYYSTYNPDLGHNLAVENEAEGGVYIGGAGYVDMGYGSEYPGNNSVYGNSPCEVANQTTIEIPAEYNWWNDVNGPSSVYGPVDYTPWLVADPNSIIEKAGDARRIADFDDGEDNPFRTADSLFSRGEFGRAFDLYRDRIGENPSDARVFNAIRRLRQCGREAERLDDWRAALSGLQDHRDVRAGVRPLLSGLAAADMADQGDCEEASAVLARVIRGLDREDAAAPTLLFQQGMILAYELRQYETAAEVFSRFMELYRNHPMHGAARKEFNACVEAGENIDSPRDPSKGVPDDLPEAFDLASAYPNPFNDFTTIRYAVPEQGPVKIALYNVLGRQVKEIVNKSRRPGFYDVRISGSDLNSGIYFCKMNSGRFEKTVRLIYLK